MQRGTNNCDVIDFWFQRRIEDGSVQIHTGKRWRYEQRRKGGDYMLLKILHISSSICFPILGRQRRASKEQLRRRWVIFRNRVWFINVCFSFVDLLFSFVWIIYIAFSPIFLAQLIKDLCGVYKSYSIRNIYSMHGVEVTNFYAITILKRFARAASGPVICIEIWNNFCSES